MQQNLLSIEIWTTRGRIYIANNGDWVLYSTGQLPSGGFGVGVFPGRGDESYREEDRPDWSYVRKFRLRKDAKARVMQLLDDRRAKKSSS